MKGNNGSINSWFGDRQIRNIEQKFDGAGRIGLTWAFRPTTQIGIGYRLQGKIHIKNNFSEDTFSSFENTYGNSHQFSAIANHEFQWQSLKLPVFIGYQMTFMPESKNSYLLWDYQEINVPDRDNPQHSLSAGINAMYLSIGFYLAARWDHGKVQVMNNSTPPWS
jgi:hypothetical protein